jgi:hypothetical protein
MVMPCTLHIYPDKNCEYNGRRVEIGISSAFLIIDALEWQPSQDSVFRRKRHPNVEPDATPGGVKLIGPTDEAGRIAGEPLRDELTVRMEPKKDNAGGSIEMSVRVLREGFAVKPRDEFNLSETQKFVIDSIFSDAYPKDGNQRLIVASEIVRPRPAAGNS